jgi:hypothetical protein
MDSPAVRGQYAPVSKATLSRTDCTRITRVSSEPSSAIDTRTGQISMTALQRPSTPQSPSRRVAPNGLFTLIMGIRRPWQTTRSSRCSVGRHRDCAANVCREPSLPSIWRILDWRASVPSTVRDPDRSQDSGSSDAPQVRDGTTSQGTGRTSNRITTEAIASCRRSRSSRRPLRRWRIRNSARASAVRVR